MDDRMSSKEFQDLIVGGALIPTRRGLLTATEEMRKTTKKLKEAAEHKKKMDKQGEANKRYLAKIHPSRNYRKDPASVGYIDAVLIAKQVRKWNKVNGIFIPYDVTSLKNSKQIIPYMDQDGNARFTLQPSKASIKYRKMAAYYWIMARDLFVDRIKGMKFPLVLGFFFIRKRDATFDYHNLIQYPMDLMRDFGWIPDDNSLYVIGFPLGHTVESKCPGLVIIPYSAKTIPMLDHPYNKVGFPDAVIPKPSMETLMLWEAMKQKQNPEKVDFYEEEELYGDDSVDMELKEQVPTGATEELEEEGYPDLNPEEVDYDSLSEEEKFEDDSEEEEDL